MSRVSEAIPLIAEGRVDLKQIKSNGEILFLILGFLSGGGIVATVCYYYFISHNKVNLSYLSVPTVSTVFSIFGYYNVATIYKRIFKVGSPYNLDMITKERLEEIDNIPIPSQDKQKKRREEAWDCPCPFYKTLYVQGKLKNVDELGYASMHEMYTLMDWAGVGRSAFPTVPYNRKFAHTGIPILHIALNRPNDTRVMHWNLTEEERNQKWEILKGFANSKGEFGMYECERIIDHNAKLYGATNTYLSNTRGELVSILTVFGHSNGSWLRNIFGLKVVTLDDMEALWIRNEFPKGWLNRKRFSMSRFSLIDISMAARFMCMRFMQKPYTTVKSVENSFSPFDHVRSPGRDFPVPNESKYPNGKLCLFDSRCGGIQPVIGGREWEFTEKHWQVNDY